MNGTAEKARESLVAPSLDGYPAVGVLPRYLRDPVSTMVSAEQEGGDVVRLDLGVRKMTLLTRPDHVERVLKDNSKNYAKGLEKFRAMLGDGLPLSDGESWLRQRRLVQPAFHRRRLATFATTMVEETLRMLDRWEAFGSTARPLDAAAEMTLLTQRVIVNTVFGNEVGTEGEKIAQAFDVVLSGFELRFLMPLWFTRLPLPANRRFDRALATLDEAVCRIIRVRRRDGRDSDDLLGMLLSARDEDTGEYLSDREVRDQVLTFYLAGHETTAVALSWAWYLLSKNPGAARKVREEAYEVLGGREPEVGDLPALVYTRMVVDETLRLYPPAWVFSRRAVEDDDFGGYRVPAGSTVALSPYVTHRRSDLWENPEGFDPERFRPGGEGAEERRPRYAYFPFGGGPRQCIGNNFALMEATLIIATVIRRYRLDLVPGRRVNPKARGTLKPERGVWVVPRAVADAASFR